MARKLASAGLALSVIWAVISLVVKGGVGVSRADGVVDFNLTSAKAEITHETATTCLNSSFVSCQGIGPVTNETNSTQCLGPGCFLPVNSLDSDSYEILANLAFFNSTELQQDLNNDIQFALAPGSCAAFAGTRDLSAVPPGTWTGNIPGASLHKVANKNFTIYNFEGNIPAFTTPFFDFIKFFGSSAVFDHLEFNLKIPTNGNPATMSLEGNANLCSITGPMAFAVYIQDGDGSDDFSCVNIPAPDFETLDISSAVCGVVF